MKFALLTAAAGALALAACATPGAQPRSGICNAEPGQRFVGQKADAGAGPAIRDATGAKSLRWAPPRTALTMDFREDRTTVAYDDDMIITRVTCG